MNTVSIREQAEDLFAKAAEDPASDGYALLVGVCLGLLLVAVRTEAPVVALACTAAALAGVGALALYVRALHHRTPPTTNDFGDER